MGTVYIISHMYSTHTLSRTYMKGKLHYWNKINNEKLIVLKWTCDVWYVTMSCNHNLLEPQLLPNSTFPLPRTPCTIKPRVNPARSPSVYLAWPTEHAPRPQSWTSCSILSLPFLRSIHAKHVSVLGSLLWVNVISRCVHTTPSVSWWAFVMFQPCSCCKQDIFGQVFAWRPVLNY